MTTLRPHASGITQVARPTEISSRVASTAHAFAAPHQVPSSASVFTSAEWQRAQAFVANLTRLAHDHRRDQLARLRHGLENPRANEVLVMRLANGPLSESDAPDAVIPDAPDAWGMWDWDEDGTSEALADYTLVAALFALYTLRRGVPHRGVVSGVSAARGSWTLGVSLRSLSMRLGGSSVERRFTALLGVPRAALPMRLRHAVALLSEQGIAVDWTRLLIDLRAWSADDRRIQAAWARAFWRRDTLSSDRDDAPDPRDERERVEESLPVGALQE